VPFDNTNYPETESQIDRDLRILRAAPCAHPIWAYASGRCAPTPVALRYEAEIGQQLQRALAQSP
jgi:hypothetical protein